MPVVDIFAEVDKIKAGLENLSVDELNEELRDNPELLLIALRCLQDIKAKRTVYLLQNRTILFATNTAGSSPVVRYGTLPATAAGCANQPIKELQHDYRG